MWWLAASLVVLLLAPGQAHAQDEPTGLERNVKAAYLYKFAGYVDWPAGTFADSLSTVTIGVIGDDALAAELAQIVVGRTSGGRPVAVRRLQALDPAPGVQMVFIARSEAARLRAVIHPFEARSVLIVTESPGALTEGSMLNFLLVNGRVRFEVALSTVETSGLVLSSRLLAVAQNVITGRP